MVPHSPPDISGHWRCGLSVTAADNSMRSACDFALQILSDGRFFAERTCFVAGQTAMGSGQVSFAAQGNWQIVSGQSGHLLALHGMEQNASGMPTRFAFGATDRGANMMSSELNDGFFATRSHCMR
jgi:hypothetical protein